MNQKRFLLPWIPVTHVLPCCLAGWPIAPLLVDYPQLTELLSGTVGLTVCMCQCPCVCTACQSTLLSPLALPFAPFHQFAPVPLSDPSSPSSSRPWPSHPFFLSRLLSRRLSLPPFRSPRPLLLSRNLSLPPSFSHRANIPTAACGVNCHKACRSRLAVECRKRTKSISHEAPPALQARSYSFPPPANTSPSLQNTGKMHLHAASIPHVSKRMIGEMDPYICLNMYYIKNEKMICDSTDNCLL